MEEKNGKVEWSDSYLLGIPEIDNQHKKLLKVANDLFDAVTGSPGDFKLNFSKTLKSLTDYTVYHFSSEEKFMRGFGYTGTDAHKMAHDGFVSEVSAQIKALGAASPAAGLRFYKYIASWVVTHIAKADVIWAKYVLSEMARK